MPIRVDIAAAVGAGEHPGASAQGDHGFILPISGRIMSSTIAGMHCSVAESALKVLNSAPSGSSNLCGHELPNMLAPSRKFHSECIPNSIAEQGVRK